MIEADSSCRREKKFQPLTQEEVAGPGRYTPRCLPWHRRTCHSPAWTDMNNRHRGLPSVYREVSLNVFAAPYTTVVVLVEDLRRQRDAVAGLVLLRNVGPHPHAVLLVAGDVQLGVVHFESLQEADHILLLLLDLGRDADRRNAGDTTAFLHVVSV